MRKMLLETLGVTAAVAAAILAGIGPVLAWVGKSVYSENLELLYWSLGATVLYAVGMVAHYGNYAQRRDGLILAANLAGLAAFVAWAAAFAGRQGAVVVPAAVCAAYATIFAVKAAGVRLKR
jgi:hypothetical protein